ncbi:MAG: glycosyltransferase [Desulfuromonadales bacterium]|nr:MAG: glycosyltransferase [Desulfuromonadales bacterium]
MASPLVSVIIPAWNAEKFIAETLESVFAQTWRDLEVIVVDDGSRDGTAEVVKTFWEGKAGGSIELKLICQQNGGPSKARNAGIRAAKGDYLAFLDADDVWLPETVEHLVAFVDTHPDVSMVFGDAGSFDANGVRFDSFFEKHGCPVTDERNIVSNAFEKLLESNFILTGALLLRRECIDRVGYFDDNLGYGEDYDLWVRITLFHKIGCINDRLMMRRMHGSNLSKQESNFYDAKIGFLNKLGKRYGREIRELNIDLNRHVLNTMKTKAYLLYLRKEYVAYVKALWSFAVSYLKNCLLKAGSAG